MNFSPDQIEQLVLAAQNASEAIMNVYNTSFDVEVKQDESPLTLADLHSNEIIVRSLHKLFPEIPIISEEQKNTPYTIRKHYTEFWLVDPLDGTKEFVKRNGEFTINIALVKHGSPVYGLIAQPATGILWHNFNGSLIKLNAGSEELIPLSVADSSVDQINVVASRSHMNEETTNMIEQLKALNYSVNIVNAGSALKFCLICENKAHIYPRIAPTMEWDTAAGEALIHNFGGSVIDIKTKQTMVYNKESLVNNPFLVLHPSLKHIAEKLM